MAIFSKMFMLFDKNKPHKELIEQYIEIDSLAECAAKMLKNLRGMQKNMVAKNMEQAGKTNNRTGSLGLEKTLFIEEQLTEKLVKLSKKTAERFEKVCEDVRSKEPVSPLEQAEMQKIKEFLNNIMKELPSPEELEKARNDRERLQILDESLRNVTNLSKKFNEIEKYEKDLARKVLDNEISRLMRRVFEQAQPHPASKTILTSEITHKELKLLTKEAKKINACQDPRYSVIWRRWWQDRQIPEFDKNTPLKKAHVNVAIKLDGESKDIHLLMKDAA